MVEIAANKREYKGVNKLIKIFGLLTAVNLLSVGAHGVMAFYSHVDGERQRYSQPYPNERMDDFEKRLDTVIGGNDLAEIKSRLNLTDGVIAMLYLSYKQNNPNASWVGFMDELANARASARKAGGLIFPQK